MARPLIVYDDSCYFCTWVAEHSLYYGPFEIVGLSDVSDIPDNQQERLPDDYEECSQLLTDEEVYSCGEAAERTLVRMFPTLAIVFFVFNQLPGYPDFREWLYHTVSKNRPWIQKVIHSEPPAEGHSSRREQYKQK
jgi:hypothetical protein